MNDQQPLVEAQDVVKRFKSHSLFGSGVDVCALDHVSLKLYPGETVALIGESGSGKTTLGKILLRLCSLTSGTVRFDGVDLFSLGAKALRQARKDFQMIFQNQLANLHPKLTVGEMLDESLRLHRPELDLAARQAQTAELLGQVGLVDKLDVRPARLSGGERRRVGLARILATRPKLVIADEPTSGLDAAIKLQMISLLKELKAPETTYLIISHDLGLVRRIASRIIVLLKGRIVEDFPISRLDGGVAHHPYTERLMQAADLFDANGDRRGHKAPSAVEEGFLSGRTDPISAQQGCVYAHDCHLKTELGLVRRCDMERPPLINVALGHRLACFAGEKGTMSTLDKAPSQDFEAKEKG